MTRLFAVAIALVLANGAAANCPSFDDPSLFRVGPALDALAPKMKACAHNPETTGLYGGLLLRGGYLSQALIWLEKSLLLDPEQPGVQADFALALAAVGDSEGSSDLASQVMNRSDVPGSVVGVLASLTSGERWEQKLKFLAGIGLASNAEFAPEIDSLDLTFGDDGTVTIPLETPSDPSPRGLFQQSLSWVGGWQGGDIRFSPAISVTERKAAGGAEANSQMFAGEVWIEHSPSKITLAAGFTGVDFESNYDKDEWFVATQVRVNETSLSCQWLVGARYGERVYDSSIYDGQVQSLSSNVLCPQGWRFGIKQSRDTPKNNRAGGVRTSTSLSAARQMSVRSGQLQLGLVIASENDSDTYSEFLARGEPRTIETLRAEATWEVPISRNWVFAPSISHVKQTSNIGLFNVNGSELLVNMIYIF